jgi:hypothetical protein
MQAVSSLAEVDSVKLVRDLDSVQGTQAVVTFKHRSQAADVQRQLALNLFMLAGACVGNVVARVRLVMDSCIEYFAGYAIPVQAVFEHGAIDDDFDPALLHQRGQLDPDHSAETSRPVTSAELLCWPDDMVLLGGSLAGEGWGGPGAMLVPRAHPDIIGALAAEALSTGSGGDNDAPAAADESMRQFQHCGVKVTVSKHAPPRDSTKDRRRQLLTTTALPLPRAAARLASSVAQQPRFAQPGEKVALAAQRCSPSFGSRTFLVFILTGTLEFDYACAWRRLQVWAFSGGRATEQHDKAFDVSCYRTSKPSRGAVCLWNRRNDGQNCSLLSAQMWNRLQLFLMCV